MKSRIAIAVSALTLGAALAVVPSFAQTSGQPGGTAAREGSTGCVRFQTECSNKPYPMPQSAATSSRGGAGRGPQQNASATSERNSARRNLAYRAGSNREAMTDETYGFGEQNRYYNAAPGAQFGPVASDDIQWCAMRFRSFDPATGTYMGFDGIRHACP